MARQVYADNVDANGKVFETVGENIRKGARAGELLNYKEILEKGEDLTHPLETFYKERISPILISTLEEIKPIDWDNSIYGY